MVLAPLLLAISRQTHVEIHFQLRPQVVHPGVPQLVLRIDKSLSAGMCGFSLGIGGLFCPFTPTPLANHKIKDSSTAIHAFELYSTWYRILVLQAAVFLNLPTLIRPIVPHYRAPLSELCRNFSFSHPQTWTRYPTRACIAPFIEIHICAISASRVELRPHHILPKYMPRNFVER